MSAAVHVLALLVITLRIHGLHGACPVVPANFLEYGPGHTHAGVILSDVNGNEFEFFMPYLIFGWKAGFVNVRLNEEGSFDLETFFNGYVNAKVLPRDLGYATPAERDLRVGEVYVRYSTNPADLDQLESMICVHFDGAIIITYVDIGLTETAPKSSYQIIVAHRKQQTIILFNYGTPSVNTARYVQNTLQSETFPLDEMDILDDGITIMDITYNSRVADGNKTRVLTPCPSCPDIPDSFFTFGAGTSDTSTPAGDIFGQPLFYPMPYDMFGWTAPATIVVLMPSGFLAFSPDQFSGSAPGVHAQPVNLGSYKRKIVALRVGTYYMRHSTDKADLDQVDALICDKTIESVIIITYKCVGLTALEPMSSYQIIVAQSPDRTLLIFIFGSPSVSGERFIRHGLSSVTYPLNETDIADNGITITDVTALPTQTHGDILPVEEETPCPDKTCEIFADGRITTLNDDTVQGKLTVDKNIVAAVDKGANEPNNDPCKFFLMIFANNLVPTRFVRVAVGVHTNNDSKYLRKFRIPLDDDSFVTEFGQGPEKTLRVADMPYTMDDTGSATPLGITVDVTEANDGWIIKSATCGYSFTYLWGGQDPMVTMTLEGDRYDGRIVETCGEI